MLKKEFLDRLRAKLSCLPSFEIEERINFYSEMIDDRMEEGISEEDAVSEIGSVNETVHRILSEFPLTNPKRETPERKLNVWKTVLLVLGSPVWLSLVAAAFAVIVSLYAVMWVFVCVAWTLFVALGASAPYLTVAGIISAFNGGVFEGVAEIIFAVVCAGLAVLAFFGSKSVTKAIYIFSKKSILCLRLIFKNNK